MKRVLIGLVATVFALVVLVVVALMLVDVNQFRPQIQGTLSEALGRQVTVGKLHVAVWSGALDADDVRIGEDPAFGKQPFVSAKSLELGVRLWPLLLHRELRITSLSLQQPQVRLLQKADGSWNFAKFGSAPSAPAEKPAADATDQSMTFSVDHLRINDGSIVLQRAVGAARQYRNVQLSADHVGLGAAFPFAMSAAMAGGGSLKLDGTLGPWHAGDAVLTPLDAHLLISNLDLVGAGLVTGADGVGGVLDIDTHIVSDKGVLKSKGHIEARKLKLVASGSPSPQPLSVDYQATYKLNGHTGKIDHGTLGTGGAKLSLSGDFDNRKQTMQLKLRIIGKQLPIDDLQPLLPVFGVVLPQNSHLSGGSLTVDLRAAGPLDALVISGPVSLDNTRLAGYSLGAKLGGALSLAGIKAPQDTVIRHAEANLKIQPAGIDADAMSAQIVDLGSITGQGSMAADGKLDFRMLVKLDKAITGAGQTGQGLGGLLGNSGAGKLLGGVLAGTSDQGIGVRVAGTASEPSFKLDPGAVSGLIKAGLGGAVNKSTPEPRQPTKPASKKDVLKDLLRGALGGNRNP